MLSSLSSLWLQISNVLSSCGALSARQFLLSSDRASGTLFMLLAFLDNKLRNSELCFGMFGFSVFSAFFATGSYNVSLDWLLSASDRQVKVSG